MKNEEDCVEESERILHPLLRIRPIGDIDEAYIESNRQGRENWIRLSALHGFSKNLKRLCLRSLCLVLIAVAEAHVAKCPNCGVIVSRL